MSDLFGNHIVGDGSLHIAETEELSTACSHGILAKQCKVFFSVFYLFIMLSFVLKINYVLVLIIVIYYSRVIA